MKSIAKLVFFLIMMILIVTTCIEVIVLYMIRAEVVAMTGHVAQNTMELSPAHLADQEIGIAAEGYETTSIFSYGFVDVFEQELETYFASAGQTIDYVQLSNLEFDGVIYDYALQYYHSGVLDDSTKIHNMTIYINMEPQRDDILDPTRVTSIEIQTVIDADTYFKSDILRGTIGANKMAGPLVYYDTVYYTIIDWRY